ncbi:MAG: thiol-disulfide isomerase/thioredoxin [Spirosomataceae bacterium]|jgi:thiol-disulfide isomerase/thioredoxin
MGSVMKKTIIILTLTAIVAVIGYMAYKINGKLVQKEAVATFTETLKPFTFKAISGDSVSVTNESKSAIFFFFNTECEHCQAEAALVKREIKQFDEKVVYFLSTEPIDKITAFAATYGLENIENVTFGSISPATATAFGISGFPTTLIYSEEGKLLKKFKGEVKIEALTSSRPFSSEEKD